VSYTVYNPRLASGEVRNEQTHDELTELGGQDQIPYLVDTDRQEALYESDDIVDYLEEHYS
jgi:glutathione S-transferase